jgi:succinate-acetate transporter protein
MYQFANRLGSRWSLDVHGVPHLAQPVDCEVVETRNSVNSDVVTVWCTRRTRYRTYTLGMFSGVPSLSRSLWLAAYCLAFWALTHFLRVAVDGFWDHRYLSAVGGVSGIIFALCVMVLRYPNGLRKFPIVEPKRPAPRPRGRG